MARKKNNEKNAFEETCKITREAAKNFGEKHFGEKSGKWPEKGEVLGALKLIAQILNEMNEVGMSSNTELKLFNVELNAFMDQSSDALPPAFPLMVNLANTYDQKAINVAILLLLEHLDDGLLKKVSSEDCLISKLTEEEKAALVHRLFYISFSVNTMFLFDREERTI